MSNLKLSRPCVLGKGLICKFSWSPISAEEALYVEMEKLNIPFIPF